MLYTIFCITLTSGASLIVTRELPCTEEHVRLTHMHSGVVKVEGISSNPKEALCL